MANPHYQLISTTGNGVGAVYPDWVQSPFNLAYVVEVPAGVTVSYTVQFTLDDPNDAVWTPVWVPDAANGTAQTATATGLYQYPIRGLSVNVSAISGGAIRLAVLQGMSSR